MRERLFEFFLPITLSKFGELLKILLLTVFQNKNLWSSFSMMISKLRSQVGFVFTAYAIVDLIYYQLHRITRKTSSYLIDVLFFFIVVIPLMWPVLSKPSYKHVLTESKQQTNIYWSLDGTSLEWKFQSKGNIKQNCLLSGGVSVVSGTVREHFDIFDYWSLTCNTRGGHRRFDCCYI